MMCHCRCDICMCIWPINWSTI